MRQMLLDFVVVLMLLTFASIGIAHIFKPDYFLKRSGLRRGGELLTEWNRVGFQIVGAIFAAFAIFLLYEFFRG
jgi:hypothetical protein